MYLIGFTAAPTTVSFAFTSPVPSSTSAAPVPVRSFPAPAPAPTTLATAIPTSASPGVFAAPTVGSTASGASTPSTESSLWKKVEGNSPHTSYRDNLPIPVP